MASGVLPVALGEATKTITFSTNAGKTYRFTITFGSSTDTDDAEGQIIKSGGRMPSEQEILDALPSFIGKIEQVPPIYSAIKVDGKRSYDLARKGKAAELKPRIVEVNSLKLLKIRDNTAEMEMDCGKGTYVRSIARDLAEKLNTYGHVSVLRRARVGKFHEKDAILLENLENLVHIAPPLENFPKGILPVEAVLDDIPVLHLDQSKSEALRQGKSVNITDYPSQNKQTVCALYNGKLVAITNFEDGRLKPVRVFNH